MMMVLQHVAQPSTLAPHFSPWAAPLLAGVLCCFLSFFKPDSLRFHRLQWFFGNRGKEIERLISVTAALPGLAASVGPPYFLSPFFPDTQERHTDMLRKITAKVNEKTRSATP